MHRARQIAASVAVALLAVAADVPVVDAAGNEPPAWDPRIERLVRFVERERGLRFEHPIRVRFLSDAEFRKELRGDDDDVTDADRRAAAADAARLHALGLAPAGVDLIEATHDDFDATVDGYYDQDEVEMVIRGTRVRDVSRRVTVVHELTHALQDQHFDLDRLDAAATTASKETAELALVEGDAVLVEEAYVASLSDAEQDRYYEDTGGADVPDASGAPDTVPAVLDAELSAPYVIGPPFVDLLASAGERARDRAFRRAPDSDEQVIDPVAYARGERPRRVPPPALASGELRVGRPQQLGALGVFMLLSARIADHRALLDAVTGWHGDRLIGFTRDERDCVRVAIATDTAADARELRDALDTWVALGPAGAATVERPSKRLVQLSACSVDPVAPPSADTMNGALDVLSERLYFYGVAEDFGLGSWVRRCVGDHLATDPEMVELSYREKWTEADEDRYATRFADYASRCGIVPADDPTELR
jgi:hypothetical protein